MENYAADGQLPLALAPWLLLQRLEYQALDERWALVRLGLRVDRALRAPAKAALIVSHGREGHRHEALLQAIGVPAQCRRVQPPSLWQASFGVRLDVVEYPQALFKLTIRNGIAVALPTPVRVAPDAQDPPELVLEAPPEWEPISARAVRRHVVTLASVVTLAASGSAVAMAAAAPAGAPGAAATSTVTSTTSTSTTVSDAPTQTTTTTSTGVLQPPQAPLSPTPPASAGLAPAPAAPAAPAPPGAHHAPPQHSPSTSKVRHSRRRAATRSRPKPAHAQAPHAAKRRHPRRVTHHLRHATPHPSGGAPLAPRHRVDVEVLEDGPAPALNASPVAGPTFFPGSSGPSLDPFSQNQLGFPTSSGAVDQPPTYLVRIYKAAGRRYRVPWQILAAINSIETNYGRDLSVSSAGAMGWMQFMPQTWAQYGVAAHGHHRPNPYDPWDAIFSAARYLAANGARHDLQHAILAYNHAQWYVDEVLGRAELMIDAWVPLTRGQRARLVRNGLAAAPAHAPQAVRRMIAAGNQIVGKPYTLGGAHGMPLSLVGSTYDCSSSVDHLLYGARLVGLMDTVPSGTLMSYGLPGPGRWVTIYASPEHVFMYVAGLRWDTHDAAGFGDGSSGIGWHPMVRASMGFAVRHPAGL